MPTEAWYLLIVVLGVVVVLAIWKGRGIKIRRDEITVEAVRESQREGGVSVLSGSNIKDSTLGNVTGRSVTGGGTVPEPPKQAIDVLGGAKVTRSHVGDVVGDKQEGNPGK